MPFFRREVFSTEDIQQENSYILSYISDSGLKSWEGAILTSIKNQPNEFKNTFAIGNGSSYQYPHAAFIGTKQVYPSIIKCNFCTLRGISQSGTPSSNAFNIFNYAPVALLRNTIDSSYIFPGTFIVSYAANMSNTYSTVAIPSFNPRTQTTSTQWAYYKGTTACIKDPVFTKNIPIQYHESNVSPTNYYTYFKIMINDDTLSNLSGITNIAKTNKALYETTYTPLSYTVVGSANQLVLRRQCVLSSENTTFMTYKETINNPSTYNIFKIYYKGQLLTNLTESLAYIMPQSGAGSREINQTGHGAIMEAGSDPTYFIPREFTSPTGNYTVYYNQSGSPGDIAHAFNSQQEKMNSLFNMFLIKVNGNENMNAFGQQFKYNNFKSCLATPHFAGGSNTIPVSLSVNINNAFGAETIITRTQSNDPQFVSNTNNPINSTKICSLYNKYSGTNTSLYISSGSISHKFNNYLNNGIVTNIKYMAYETARTFVDVNNIAYSILLTQGAGTILGYTTNVNINMNTPTLTTMTPANTNTTYTYCYLAADVIGMRDMDTLVINRVLSSTYLCIKKETVTGSGTSTTTWTTRLV